MLAVVAYRQRPEKDPVLRVNGKDWTFTDSGKNGDVKQGDGIYSATPVMKLTSFVSEQASGSKEPLLGLDEIVEGFAGFPMFEGREVIEDDAQIEHIKSIVNDPRIREQATNLKSLLPSLAKMTDLDLLKKLGVDPKITPVAEVLPRGAKDALVRVMGIPAVVFSSVIPASINPANSLMITSPAVIKDPTRTAVTIPTFPRPCTVMPFTVIFEYNNPQTTCQTIKLWQENWYALRGLSLGSSAYNSTLASLTTSVVNDKRLLAHVRTNEAALASPWQLREFRLNSRGQLALDPLEGTPMANVNGSTLIPNCLVNEPSLFTPSACNAAADSSPTTWDSPNFTIEVSPLQDPLKERHTFAMGTCSGCHTVETTPYKFQRLRQTEFTHIGTGDGTARMGNGEFMLSRFLTGKYVVEGLDNASWFSAGASFGMTTPGGS